MVEIYSMFGKFLESIRARLRAREDEEALANLSDAALADIGLTRGDLVDLQIATAPARTEQAAAEPFLAGLAFPAAARFA